MSLDLVLIIATILGLILVAFIFGFIFMKLVKNIIGAFVIGILLVASVTITILAIVSFRDSITSDYRCVDTIDTYPVYNISFEGDDTVVHYINTNNEIVHIKSDKAKIFYDLADDREPYVIRNKYWRWFIYWEELDVHIKE